MYGMAFAAYYNQNLNYFSETAAKLLYDALKGRESKEILDVCCGTGKLGHYFLSRGFKVHGIDLSNDMLHYARKINQAYIDSGDAIFEQMDVTSMNLDQTYPIVISTFDALNHLNNREQLNKCFKNVYRFTQEGGIFIFDLNTYHGLSKASGSTIQEYKGQMHITKNHFDFVERKGSTRYYGYLPTKKEDLYVRYDETITNTVFAMNDVADLLFKCGWSNVSFHSMEDLEKEITEPEKEDRVYVMAKK
ncbi:class I SAM-dependent DNA methyltransferase [Alkalihalobacillus sp. NPDC078783]